jgi:phage-related protein
MIIFIVGLQTCAEVRIFAPAQPVWFAPTLAGSPSRVLEMVEDFRSDTYRAVYTVKFAGWVYVLHCFQKKSKSGIKTPKEDMDLINARLKAAKQDFETWKIQQGVPK